MTLHRRLIHALVVALMLLGLGASSFQPAAALAADAASDPTAGIDGNTYTSPTYDYSLEWDEDVWTPDYEASRERGYLVFDLIEPRGVLFLDADDGFNGDPRECLAGRSDKTLSSDMIDNVELYEDETGDAVAGEEDGVAYAAYTVTLTLDDGTEQDFATYFECRTLIEGGVVLAVNLATGVTDLEEAQAELDDLLATLDLSDVASATGGDDVTAIPAADDAVTRPGDRYDGDPGERVDGNVYTSPTYGYTLEWDEDVLSLAQFPTNSKYRDVLAFTFVTPLTGTLKVAGYDAYGGDPDACLDSSSAETLKLPDVSNAKPYEDRNDNPVAGEAGGVAFVAYSLNVGSTAAAGYFTCQTLVEGEAVITISLVTPEEYFEEARLVLDDLLATLTLAEGSGGTQGGDWSAVPERDDDTVAPVPEDEEVVIARDGRASRTRYRPLTFEWRQATVSMVH